MKLRGFAPVFVLDNRAGAPHHPLAWTASMDDLELLRNGGILTVGEMPPAGDKTVIVLGVARGGTSIVAGALHHLGVFMGDDAKPAVFEDLRLANALEGQDWGPVRDTIADYDGRHSTWGFKRPDAFRRLGRLQPLLRCPVYVAIFRDILAIANRNALSMRLDALESMASATEAYGEIIRFIRGSEKPSLLLSMEKVLLHKELLVDYLVRYLGLASRVTDEQRTAALDFISIDSPEYLRQTSLEFRGNVGHVTPEFVGGWAWVRNHGRPASVRISVNGKHVGRAVADELRHSLKKKKVHPTGRCGFRFEFSDDGRPAVGDSVAVQFELGGEHLPGSPKVVRAPDARTGRADATET